MPNWLIYIEQWKVISFAEMLITANCHW